MKIDVSPKRVLAARILAIAADAVQLGGFPVFGLGIASPYNDALDVVVAGALTWLVGFHWAFLPSFLIELVPGIDLVPTWTGAVLLATRGQGKVEAEPPTQEPEPAREPEKNITPGRR